MQSFADAIHVADSMEALVKSFLKRATRLFQQEDGSFRKRATRLFQPEDGNESEYIRESTEEHLLHFSNQIVIVQEIYMALLKDGYIPRRPTQWMKKATDLKSKVRDALKEEQNSKDPSLRHEELKRMCDEMFDSMKHCPVEDVNDKPMAFIARMHETEDRNLDSKILPDELQAQDVEKEEASSDRVGKDTIKTGGHSRTASNFSSSLKVRSEYTLISKGKSSQAHDVEILQISSKGTSSPSMRVKQTYRPRRRREKMPMAYASDIIQRPGLRLLTSENNPSELREEMSSSSSRESKQHGERVATPGQTYDKSFTHVDESELGMTIPILPIGKMPEYVDVRLQILSMSPSQATLHLNNDFGLHPEMDNYFFSALKKPAELELENLIVDRSGSRSKEMPTDEEWREAGVVNLIEKNTLLLNEEPDCPNLVILFLQRNSRLTHIPSSFFNQMPALHFLDLSGTRIKALPSSLFNLKKLQVLLLRSCVCLDSLPAEVKNLINMEVLDLLGTDLSDLPKEMGELTQLRHLQLSFYRSDYESTNAGELVSSDVISKLQALQGLSIVVHPKDRHWRRIVRAIITQVGKLKMLSYLQFYFPSVEALKYFSKISFTGKEQILRRFKFLVGHNIKRILSRIPDEVESKYEQYDRCLRFVNGSEVPQVMKSIIKQVTAFYLDNHLEIQSLSEFDVSSFKELKFCVLRECPNIQVMIIGEKRTKSAFPNLEYLALHYLWKLERIWEDPVPSGSYQALKYLMIGTCGKLEYIACHAILRSLSNLETFIIEDCECLKSIVKQNEVVKYDGPLLPRLKELVLRHLPQLVALGRGLFPSEGIISIHFCPKLILRPGHSRIEWKKLLGSNICSSAQTSI